jgi:two-component system, OmpR family, sensor kinase
MMVHVFPAGPLCSLRRALMLWLLPVFLLVGAAAAGFAWWSYNHMVSTFMDNQMSLLADSIARQDEDTMVRQAQTPTTSDVHEWGTYVVQVFDADGRARASTWPRVQVPLQSESGFHDVRQDKERWRVYVSPPGDRQGQPRVQVLQSASFRAHLAAGRAGAALAPVLILLPLSMLILWGVAAAMSRALGDVARQVAQQDEHSLTELSLARVPQEISPLVMAFNSLLSRLRAAFAAQRRFVQDAAHELRTPIAAIGLQLENLRGDLGHGAAGERFSQLEAGVQRAQRMVDQLLKLSRQETAAAQEPPSAVDLRAQVHDSINALIALADQRRIDLGLLPVSDDVPANLALRCASSDLRSVLDNLLENALRYTPEGGVVDVRLALEDGQPVIEVIDSGPGIPNEELGRVFDRFYRVPGTGARGSGLGLSIAQSAAQRCGLRITLANRTDGVSGLVARVSPLAAG